MLAKFLYAFSSLAFEFMEKENGSLAMTSDLRESVRTVFSVSRKGKISLIFLSAKALH